MNFIDNQWLPGKGTEFHSINPANEEIIWTGNASSETDVDAAVQAAHKSFSSWRQLPLQQKNEIFERFKEFIERDKESFARLISDESGKPFWECLTEVGAMIGKLAISLNAYEQRCKENSKEMPGNSHSATRWRAIGPMAVFGPFNLPVHLPNGHIIPALIAGNTVVFKPSEQTPACAQKMVELWHEAGLPAGVINLVQGSRDTGMALTTHRQIKGVLFTGSYTTGVAIHQALAGKPEVILALEMGGNNPLLVWDAKDLQAAAYTIVQSAFITSGQRCVCARRLIIPKGEYGDTLIKELLNISNCIRVGLPRDKEEPFMGPLISKASANNMLEAQQELLNRGATSLLEMKQLSASHALLTPGVIDVSNLSHRNDHEYFGPLLQVIRVSTFEEAISEANNTAFGLSAGLICDTKKTYQHFFNQCSAGIINWNRQITGASSAAPFGGSGKSGNFRPGASLAADYCAYPVASIESPIVEIPAQLPPGITIT